MSDVRRATIDDFDLVAHIGAAGFYDDPVLSWIFPDPSARLDQLTMAFTQLVGEMVPDGGEVYLCGDASVALWRDPSFDHEAAAAERAGDMAGVEAPFPPESMERFEILETAMLVSHPHEPHWYLNILSTIPARQGQGLGGRLIAAVTERCDAEGIPAYLESTNPRNMSLYRRHGFVETGEIPLKGGPSLYPMWRDPAGTTGPQS